MLNTIIFGRYEIKKQSRENELLVEYWGEDTKTGRDIMVDVIRILPAAEFFARFNPMNKKFAGIHSPHLPLLVELGEADGLAVVIHQYVDGQTLRAMLDMGHYLPLELVLVIAQQLGEYLDLLHQSSLTQIAFEPEDVLIAAGDSMYVTNFGFANGVDLGTLLSANKIPTRISYAPELIQNGKADARADFYSLGALLFEALTGKKPSINSESAEKTLAAEGVLPSRLRMGIPPEWDALIAKCLNPNPAKRIQSAAEFLNQVDEIRRSMDTIAGNTPLGMEDSLVGQTLGSYRLVSRLGQGGMATVYKAYEPALDRYVAVKVLPQFFAKDPIFVQRFRREAKAVAQLSHPNIVPIYSYGETNGITYIAMQFVIGDTLKHEGQKFTFEESLRLLSPIARALGYAHQRGVVHRDIKPSNILIAEDEHWPLLADFGLAQMAQVSGKLTESGVGMGTPMYMSPEQGQGEKVDHRTDIYSLGIVLYELITGDVPFRADTPMAIVIKHISAPMPMPSKVNPDVPDYLEAIILKATAKNPDDRYQTAEEMARAMETALAQLSSTTPITRSSPPSVVTSPPKESAPAVKPLPKPKTVPVTQIETPHPTATVLILKGIGSFFKGIYRLVIFLIILGLLLPILIVGGMAALKICPPQGPWPQPPWCAGSPYEFMMGEQSASPTPELTMPTNGEFGDILFQDDFDGGISPRWQFTCDKDTSPWIVENIDGRTVFHSQPPKSPGNVSCAEVRDTGWQNYAIVFNFKFLKPNLGSYYFSLGSRATSCPPNVAGVQEYRAHITNDGVFFNKGTCKPLNIELAASDVDIDPNSWHTLQYIFIGNRVQLIIDNKPFIDLVDEDNPITESGDIWLITEGKAEILVDDLKVYEIVPSASVPSQPYTLVDDFESETYWGESFEEGKDTKIGCFVNDSHTLRDSNYLQFDFDVFEKSWGTCGFYFDETQNWQDAKGITFQLRADQPNMPYEVTLFGSGSDEYDSYLYSTRTSPASVNEWVRVDVPWSDFLRVEWEDHAGAPFDPSIVNGLIFGISAGQARQIGTLWVDDLGLLESAPPPARADLFSEDFEHPAWTHVESYAQEDTDTKVTCDVDASIGRDSEFSLKYQFDAFPDTWASCGFSFDTMKDWRTGNGIAFFVHSSKGGLPYAVNIITSPADKDELHIYNAVTAPESVNGWARVELRWDDLRGPSWEANANMPLDPFAVTGLWFDIDVSSGQRETGVIWIDDIEVIP